MLYQGLLYVLMDNGFLLCYDAKTGKETYGKRRVTREGSRFSASPWAYNGVIFCPGEDGNTYVIEAGPEFKVAGTNSLGEMTMASPAIADGSLYVRTRGNLYCIRGKG
ncbi:MAG: hypothetical protein O2968_20970 [Acidobacteria bacterium]|nr:hypothetical protein [Acidobacteriota bacterium]